MKLSVVIPLYDEVDNSRPFVDASSANPRSRWSPRWKLACFASWIVAGPICIALDGQVQPLVATIGRTELVHEIAKVWQELGAAWGIVLFFLAGALCMRSDRGRTLVYCMTAVSMAGLVAQILKRIIGRVRPSANYDAKNFLGPSQLFSQGFKGHCDSMPSGHTAAAFAMAVVLAHRWPRLKALWYGLAIGVGISRLLVNAHFPSDVVLGACLGTLVGLATTRWLIRVWPLENSRRAIMTVIGS